MNIDTKGRGRFVRPQTRCMCPSLLFLRVYSVGYQLEKQFIRVVRRKTLGIINILIDAHLEVDDEEEGEIAAAQSGMPVSEFEEKAKEYTKENKN